MSKAPQRGKLRNPPKGRRYAYIAVVAALIVVAGSGLYLYGSRIQAGSSSSSTAATFANTPCTPATSTSSGGVNGTYALICTNLGLVEVQLFPSDAPQTVANFVKLANSGYYNDIVWHRIVPGFVIQAGDSNTKNGGGNRSTWGQGTAGTNLPFENSSLSEAAGTIAMASTGAKVGGSSQFFINLVDNSASLDGNYVVFGQVINGMSVVNALAKVPTNTTQSSPEYQQPVTPSQAYIVSVTVQNTP
jgi:dolichyl-diphosphooligosaccharide---protein glycosyltransferase